MAQPIDTTVAPPPSPGVMDAAAAPGVEPGADVGAAEDRVVNALQTIAELALAQQQAGNPAADQIRQGIQMIVQALSGGPGAAMPPSEEAPVPAVPEAPTPRSEPRQVPAGQTPGAVPVL